MRRKSGKCVICAGLYFKWNKIGDVGMRVEKVWSSRTLILLNLRFFLKELYQIRLMNREIYMKGIDASYHYEGYNVYKTENLKNEQ